MIATNCHGEAKAIISLQIFAKDMDKCKATEKKGTSITHGTTETLPNVTKHLKDLRCCDGDSITLECHVSGQPEPNILWEKGGRMLQLGNDFTTSYDGQIAILSINRVYPEDEGEYTCIAENNIGRSYSSACIIVDVPEEKENMISRQLKRPVGLLSSSSAYSTPRSTPRSTPVRGVSPYSLSYRNIDTKKRIAKLAAPKFYTLPQNRVVEEGDNVRFQCVVGGHPQPWSTWDVNGDIVTPTGRIRITERDDLRILEIEQVTMDDSGLYRITLENEYGRIETTARLDVICQRRRSSRTLRTASASPRRAPWHWSRRIRGNSTAIGGRLALSCDLRGRSLPPSKKYYHNGEPLYESERVKIINESEFVSRIEIENIGKEDEGVYSCVAEFTDSDNPFVMIASTKYLEFPEMLNESQFLKVKRELDKYDVIDEGCEYDLVFEIDASDDDYDYNWYKDGKLVRNSEDFRYIDHGNGVLGLRIADPFVFDGGYYKCVVTSGDGSTVHSVCELEINETKTYSENEANIIRPDFLKPPVPVVCRNGNDVTYCCRVSPPETKTVWVVNGREITTETPGFSISSQPDDLKILNIFNVDCTQSGEVKCIAKCPNHQAIAHTDLIVLPECSGHECDYGEDEAEEDPAEEDINCPAYIIYGPQDCTALIGGTVILELIYGGLPEPTIKWMRAGRAIAENSNIVMKNSKGQSVLELTNITADESGKYTVEIMNDCGYDCASASVAVEGPPDPPGGRPSVSQGHDRVAVAWCGPPYDGGCMITGFILELQEEDYEWVEKEKVFDSLACTIKDLKIGFRYKFRVRAENIHGKSDPSLPSEEILIDYPDVDDTQKLEVASGGDFRQRFVVMEELGKGRFGVVHKVQEKENGRILAAKIIKCIKAKDRVKVNEEISIMKSLKHPKLLQLAATFETTKEIIMVLEYITGGELFERVVADDFTLTEHDCVIFLRQICEGVSYMHKKSIVHLDLKPENIMCHTKNSHQIKIIDFGLAQRLTDDLPVRVLFGTPEFIPPEIINYEPIGYQSDMWSVGVICYVLLSGLSPFMGDSDVDTFANITRADYDFDDDAFDTVSQDAKDFISSLLIHRKEERFTADECLASKWLSLQDDDISKQNTKICTDKLKKFIIRRKWQKTGNAIRALGRMATLSANSRRNSAASSTSSPRPSITTGFAPVSHLTQQMSCLNEEDVEELQDSMDSSQKISQISQISKLSDQTEAIGCKNGHASRYLKLKERSCSERSDSGFSECVQCISSEENKNEATENAISGPIICHNVLKNKLEKIASQQFDDPNANDKSHLSDVSDKESASIKNDSSTKSSSSVETADEISEEEDYKGRSVSIPDLINELDYDIKRYHLEGNSIKLRKKSLENQIRKDSIPSPAMKPIKVSSKVSDLKSKFNTQSNENKTDPTPVVKTSIVSQLKMNFDGGSNRIEPHKNTTKTRIETTSPSTGGLLKTTSGLRGRVKEVTERLSAPKKLPDCSPVRTASPLRHKPR